MGTNALRGEGGKQAVAVSSRQEVRGSHPRGKWDSFCAAKMNPNQSMVTFLGAEETKESVCSSLREMPLPLQGHSPVAEHWLVPSN